MESDEQMNSDERPVTSRWPERKRKQRLPLFVSYYPSRMLHICIT